LADAGRTYRQAIDAAARAGNKSVGIRASANLARALFDEGYGDPYLWPQLWEQNRYILDAHWIYPGDPLLIDVEVTSADEYAESVADAVPGEGGDALDDDPFRGVLTSDEAAGPPVPLGAEADIYCSGFIASREEDLPYELIGSEFGALRPQLGVSAGGDSNWRFESGVKSTRFDLSTGDVVYLDGGRIAGLAAGQILSRFSRATSMASDEMSMAWTSLNPPSAARARAIAPEPVPTSATTPAPPPAAPSTSSTRISVYVLCSL
jgi:hypothetical protein